MGKGDNRRPGDDKAFKAAPWPPESPVFRRRRTVEPYGRIYLSGPMTGLPGYNYPAFHERAAAWRDAGWVVLNPAENFGGDTGRCRGEYLRKDIADLLTVDAIAFLPGWLNSKGARLEYDIAVALELERYNAATFQELGA